MDIVRHVVVFDAADLDAESKFWAGMFRGHVFGDDTFHCIIDSSGEWRVGVQSAPDHVRRSGRTGLHSKCISTFTFKIRVLLMKWRSGWRQAAPGWRHGR